MYIYYVYMDNKEKKKVTFNEKSQLIPPKEDIELIDLSVLEKMAREIRKKKKKCIQYIDDASIFLFFPDI